MKRMTSGVLALATVLATGAVDLMAQQGPGGRRGQGMNSRRGGVEAIMRMGDRLELTDDQVGSLDALRQFTVQSQNDEFAVRNQLQSQLQAGQIDRSEFNDAMSAQREANRDLAEQQRADVEAILTEEQIESLRESRGRARAFARGRASMRGGQRGIRGNRNRGGQGFGPGAGFGPRAGFGPDGRFGPAGRAQRFQDRGGMIGQRGLRRGPGA